MKNPFFICTLVSCISYLFNRFFSLASSCWMLVDMVLDGRQTYVYKQHAFNQNGTYNIWAMEFRQTSNETHLHAVSSAYFYTAVVVWVLPPLLFSVFYFFGQLSYSADYGFNPFENTNGLFADFSSFEVERPFNSNFLNVLFCLLYFPIDLLVSSIVIYIMTPFLSLKAGFLVAWTGDDDPERKITKDTTADAIPGLKLFENLGEAIPQAILVILFIVNNWDFMLYSEKSFIPIPTSCISLFFSFGSIIMGLISGCRYFYKV